MGFPILYGDAIQSDVTPIEASLFGSISDDHRRQE